MNETTFENAKIRDKVWDRDYRSWGNIKEIYPGDNYPLKVYFDNEDNLRTYLFDGRYRREHNSRSLFWDEIPEPIAPSRPKRIVKKTIERWIKIYPNGFDMVFKKKEDAITGLTEGEICVRLTGEYKIEE